MGGGKGLSAHRAFRRNEERWRLLSSSSSSSSRRPMAISTSGDRYRGNHTRHSSTTAKALSFSRRVRAPWRERHEGERLIQEARAPARRAFGEKSGGRERKLLREETLFRGHHVAHSRRWHVPITRRIDGKPSDRRNGKHSEGEGGPDIRTDTLRVSRETTRLSISISLSLFLFFYAIISKRHTHART